MIHVAVSEPDPNRWRIPFGSTIVNSLPYKAFEQFQVHLAVPKAFQPIYDI
jgi:hypothetical protein